MMGIHYLSVISVLASRIMWNAEFPSSSSFPCKSQLVLSSQFNGCDDFDSKMLSRKRSFLFFYGEFGFCHSSSVSLVLEFLHRSVFQCLRICSRNVCPNPLLLKEV